MHSSPLFPINRLTSPCHDERGTASLELAVVVPGLVLLMALMTAGWRVWSVRAQLHDAAAAGARAASLAGSGGAARQAAERVVREDLRAIGSACTGPRILVDTSGFAIPAGTRAEVGVEVACHIALSDLLIVVPGTIHAEARADSRLDTFKERRP